MMVSVGAGGFVSVSVGLFDAGGAGFGVGVGMTVSLDAAFAARVDAFLLASLLWLNGILTVMLVIILKP